MKRNIFVFVCFLVNSTNTFQTKSEKRSSVNTTQPTAAALEIKINHTQNVAMIQVAKETYMFLFSLTKACLC
jgi:hypothetical protein